jgi:hypothetical protein
MLSRIWLTNAILVLLVVFFGLKAYGVWFQENKGLEIPERVQKPVQGVTKPLETFDERKIPPESEYNALMSLNLFSSERTEIITDETEPDKKIKQLSEVEKKNIQLSLKKITLYGLFITDDSAEALVSHQTTKPVLRRGTKLISKKTRLSKKNLTVKQTIWIKVGDTLGDFEVVAIKPDRVLLKAGSQFHDLLLYDKENIKSRRPAKPKTGPTVVGVSVKPPVTNVKRKNPTIPSTVKKKAKVGLLPGVNQKSSTRRGGTPPAVR